MANKPVIPRGLWRIISLRPLFFTTILAAIGGPGRVISAILLALGFAGISLTHLTIGVGYSSDVETVIASLLEIANNHPDVVKGNPQMADPYVLFLEFGDSSLNFELRAYITNINRCMHVTSDLNRAINTEFNKKGIEIPFPQRDVHFRNVIQVEDEAKGSNAVSPQDQNQ